VESGKVAADVSASASNKVSPEAPIVEGTPISAEATPAIAATKENAAVSADAASRKNKLRTDIGECHTADGRYAVKVTPDGVRRLYDTSGPHGSILTRIQCDGNAPRGQQGDCEKLSWPCENIHRPFKGYAEDIAEKVKPFCQVPGWHALFLGLGGGYMQTNLGKLCAADARIDTIENSPGVVPVARNMFGFNSSDPKQHLEFGDGLQGMKHHVGAGDKYDFIFTDHASESSREFMENAHHLLKPGGKLAFSKIGAYKDEWLGSLKDFFSDVEPTRTAEGNYTLMTTARALPKSGLPPLGAEDASHLVVKPKAPTAVPEAGVADAKPSAKTQEVAAKVEAPKAEAPEAKSIQEKVQAASQPEAKTPEAEAQAGSVTLEKKMQEIA